MVIFVHSEPPLESICLEKKEFIITYFSNIVACCYDHMTMQQCLSPKISWFANESFYMFRQATLSVN